MCVRGGLECLDDVCDFVRIRRRPRLLIGLRVAVHVVSRDPPPGFAGSTPPTIPELGASPHGSWIATGPAAALASDAAVDWQLAAPTMIVRVALPIARSGSACLAGCNPVANGLGRSLAGLSPSRLHETLDQSLEPG